METIDSNRQLEEIVQKQSGQLAKLAQRFNLPQKVVSGVESLEQRIAETFPGLTKEHVKGLGILAGSLTAVFMLRNDLPQYMAYFQQKLPWLSNDNFVLAMDVVSNTILAPVGFVIYSYANSKKINWKELLGQTAFAAAWGAVRHVVYIHGLNQFDNPVTFENVAKKTLWFMPYTWFYAYFYTAYSAVLSKVAHGSSFFDPKTYTDALKGKFSFNLIKDGSLWANIGLHLSNLYLNPAPNTKAAVGGALLVLYNSRVLRYSHEMKQGFLDYIKSIFKAEPQNSSYIAPTKS